MSIFFERIFSQILEMSIIAGYCVLAVLILRWLFRKAPKRYSYLLWLVVAFRLVCPLTVDSAFSIFNLKLLPESDSSGKVELELPGIVPGVGGEGNHLPEPAPEVGGSTNERPDFTLGVGGNTSAVPEIGGTMIGDSEPDSNVNNSPGSTMSPLPQLPDQTIETKPQTNLWQEIDWQIVGAWVWVLGMIILSVFMIVSWIRLKLRVRTAVKVRTRVYETDMIDSAFVLGIRKPTIYLPVGLDRQEQAWILLHETCHIWRKDYLVKMLATALTIVYWFHPLVWVAWFGMCRDMEMSCDEMALEGASAELRKAYSRTLLTVATQKRINWNAITAFGEVSVKSRIKHVLSFKKPAVWMGAMFAVVLVAALVVFGTNGQAEGDANAGENIEEETTTEADGQVPESEEPKTEDSEPDDAGIKIPELREPESKMDAMTNALWLKMLSQIDTGSKSCCPSSVDRDENMRHHFNESYDVEMVLESFNYIDAYSVSVLYNSETVADFGWVWSEAAWTEGSMSYQNVDTNHLRWSYNYSGEPYAGGVREAYLKAKENSVLQIAGSIEMESYEAGEAFIRDTAPYYYYEMWGTVLREAGDLWQRFSGDYLGQMVGQMYMVSYDVETLTGVYWICLEGESPVQLTMIFENQEGGKFSSQFDASVEWSEDISGQALMKMVFDLTTTASTVENEVSDEERFATWKENVWNVFWGYDETHPWYRDYGMFRNSVSDYDGDGVIDRKFFYILEDDYGVEYLLLSSGRMIELGETYANKTYEVFGLNQEGTDVIGFIPDFSGLEGDQWIDLAWKAFKYQTEVDPNYEPEESLWADHYTGFVDLHPYQKQRSAPVRIEDYDGDGLNDRLFQRYNEEKNTQEVYLFFGSGEMLLLDADIWTTMYSVEGADLTGDGANELLFTHHIIGADNDGSTYFSVFTKDGGSWKRMTLPGEENTFDAGYATNHWEKFELEKVDEDTIRILHPDCDSSVKVSVSEYIMKLCMDGMQTDDWIGCAKGVSFVTDPETGRTVLELSGDLGDRWEWRSFFWQLGYVDGEWKILSIGTE